MPNIGLPELAIVLVIALVVFGPKRLPEMGRQLGRTLREFKAATSDIRSQIGIDDIADSVNDLKSGLSLTSDTPRPVAETAGGAAVGAGAVVGAGAGAIASAVDDSPSPAMTDAPSSATADEPTPALDDTTFAEVSADAGTAADEAVDDSASAAADEAVDGDPPTITDEPVDGSDYAVADEPVDGSAFAIADGPVDDSMTSVADEAVDDEPAIIADEAVDGDPAAVDDDEAGDMSVEAFGSIARHSASSSARTAAD